MALDDGYGVLAGRLVRSYRDTPDDQGRWYHVNLLIDVGGRSYRAAVDVDSHASATGVCWKVVDASDTVLGPVAHLPVGWHPLPSTPEGGALDHLRHPASAGEPWTTGDHLAASVALEDLLSPGGTILVWGEPFTRGLGVHNVHQNQGDPVGSPWWDENAVWQDGGVGVAGPGAWRLFLPRFSSQAVGTNDAGHPMCLAPART